MTIPRRILAVAVALAAAILVLSEAAGAAAQVRVATVPFDGAGSAGARRQVQRALEGDRRVEPVDADRVDSSAGRVGASSSGTGGIAQLAEELEARMIIQGQVTGRGRRRRVSLTALDQAGNEVATARGAMRGSGIERAVRSLLDDGLARLPPPPAQRTEAPPPARIGTTDPEETPGFVGGEDEGGGGGGGDGGDAAPGDWSRRAPLLNAQIGLVPRSREADVVFQDSRRGRYNAWYPELAVSLEVRPLNADPSILQGLYGRVFFAHAVGLASREEGCARPDCSVENTFFRLDFAAGLLFPLADFLDLGVELGAGWDTYTLSANTLLESAEYVYIRPAVRARMRIFREYFVIGAEVGVRPVLSRGDFSRYGDAGDTIGFDVGGSLGGGFALEGNVGLTYALSVTYVNYWASFSGMADPALPAGGTSGTDGSVRIAILLGLGIW
ncbi:MAG: hypothetical protein M3Y87_03665 [Myxococcota bacterium]|nr:hypothetical protein [Myxococcota bacterium]